MDNLIRYLSENTKIWDIWKENSITRYFVYKNGELVDAAKFEKKGIGIRVNGLYYFSSNKERDVINQIKIKKGFINITQSSKEGRFITKLEVDQEFLKSLANEIIDFLKDKNIKYELVVSYTIKETHYTNSNGADIHQKYIYTKFFIDLFYEECGKVSELYFRQGSCLEPVKVNFEKLEEKIKILRDLVNAKTIKSQKTKIILDPEITDLLIHEAYGHALEKDLISREESVFSKNRDVFLGEKITIIEDPSQATWGFYKYDDEGFKSRRKILIENGKIKGFIEDGRFGKGGWGRKMDYRYYPIPRMACTILEPGDYTKEELIEKMKNGYILCGFKGGEVNTKNGNFQFGSEYAYEVKNGEIVGICKGVGFSGNILGIGKHIVVKSRDLEESIGMCGKGSLREWQYVPVSALCPYVLLKDIKI